MAETSDVEIRTYEIIYKLLEDIEAAMLGMLAPEFEEVVTGDAEVRQIFRIPRIGAIAGCYVRDGHDHPRLEGPVPARGRHHLEGHHHLAAAVQGRRPRGAGRVRVRHRPLGLPGPEGGRHHRDLRGARDPEDLRAWEPSDDVRTPQASPAHGGGARPIRGRCGSTRCCARCVAEELERLADADERLRLVTVTSVDTSPDLRHATVYLGTLDDRGGRGARGAPDPAPAGRRPPGAHEAHAAAAFAADPAVEAGERVEEVLRRLATARTPAPEREDGG